MAGNIGPLNVQVNDHIQQESIKPSTLDVQRHYYLPHDQYTRVTTNQIQHKYSGCMITSEAGCPVAVHLLTPQDHQTQTN